MLTLLLLPILVFSQAIQFDADSAFSYNEYLSVTIGPRPMGSHNEKAALTWVKSKFASFGADSAFIMTFTKAETGSGPRITNSGVAVGVFKGQKDSAIVIGGHIDSDGYNIPGANDNASGTAAMVELARVWSQRPRQYTMVFCAFGGEERGLIGSQYFTENYSRIDDVGLMFSTDMAGATGNIETIFETKKAQAPDWLVRDAFSIDQQLNLNRLSYPTHFETINSLAERGSGSDHMSFLNKGIPAIDFTVGINNSPIHTAQDKIGYIDRKAMGEYGIFVDALVQKYQQDGIPGKTSGKFLLWQIFGVQFYFPYWLVIIFNIMAIIMGAGAFVIIRSQRLRIEKKDRVRFSILKLLAMLIIVAIFAHFGEALIQLIRGYRHAWVENLGPFFLYSLIWALTGLWVALQLTKKWRFSADPYVYALHYYINLLILIILAFLLSARLALYPAMMIFLFSLAVFIRQPWLKTVLALLAPLAIYRLIAHEEFAFMINMFAMVGIRINNYLAAIIYNIILTAFIVLLSLPMIYAGGFAVAGHPALKEFLKKFRSKPVGLIAVAFVIGFGIYLLTLPIYGQVHRPVIRAEATYDLPEKKSELHINGNEYFKDLHVQSDSLDEFYDDHINTVEITQPFTADWLAISGAETVSSGEQNTIHFTWLIRNDKSAEWTTLEIRPDTASISDAQSDLPFFEDERLIKFYWEGEFPDTLMVSGRLAIAPGAKLIRKLRSRYNVLPLELHLTSQLADINYRTTVEYQDTLSFIKPIAE